MRSSGRSSAVSDVTLETSEIRRICRASSFATWLTMADFGTRDDQRERAQAVVVEEPVADVGNVLEVLADLELELALGDVAVALRRVVDDQRGAANLA